MKKRDIIQFLEWMRNGTAFVFTWFLILILLYNYSAGIESVSTDALIKLIWFVVGGVFIFCLMFTRLVFRKWKFVTRLTCFMLFICAYECVGFYWLGIFKNSGSVWQWGVFSGIVIVLYFICIGIYQQYSRKQGKKYTQALLAYQTRRNVKNEE